MEFPEAGLNCSESSCKRLDFLPLECKKCGLKYCSEHFALHGDCGVSSGEIRDLKKIQDLFACSHSGCNDRSVVALICEKCNKHFCVSHRHIDCGEKTEQDLAKEREKYAEPVRKFNEAKAEVDKTIANNLAEARKKPKTKSTATKIQLMKLKSKATGLKTVPTNDRFYFNVFHPTTNKTSAIFISKNWSIGRCIDAIAQECKLVNNNNKFGEKKLRLFKMEDGKCLEQDMGLVLGDLAVKGVVFDGEDLVIEYVQEGCEQLNF